jgi:phospholipid/cholesterol/gamma-HCH transport system substrate-binding protein
MKRENVNYTLVGIVVLIALALLLGTLGVITGRSGATANYTAIYRNVTGLAFGAPVFYEGFRIGQVEGITPQRAEGRTSYVVDLAVRRDWPIPADSVALLASTGLLADVSIAIREGSSSELLAAGAQITSQEGADLFAAFNELAGEVTMLTRNRITPLIENLSRRVDSIATNFDAQTPVLLNDAAALLKRLNEAAESVNLVLGPANRGNIDQTLASIRQVAKDLEGTQARLDQLLVDAGGIAAENRPVVRDSIRDLSQITTALARRIEAISNNLESSSRNLDEFSREIRRSPNRLLLSPKTDEVVVEDE